MKIKERIFDATTGETTDFERDATEQEIKEKQEFDAFLAQRNAEIQKLQAQRQVILDKLGLSNEEAQILLG